MGSDGRPTVQTSSQPARLRVMTETAINTSNVNVTVGNAGIPSKSELEELNEKTWFGIGKNEIKSRIYYIHNTPLIYFTLFIHSINIPLGSLSHSMDEWDKALIAYESALRHNPTSEKTLHALGRLLLNREQFGPAVEVFQRLVSVTKHPSERSEEYLAEIAICWLGMEDIGKAAAFIQKAVEIGDELWSSEGKSVTVSVNADSTVSTDSVNPANLSSPARKQHCPTLWYALGIYHDRLGNEEAALDAFLAFIESERSSQTSSTEISDRAREIYFRLGVIYRLMGKLKEARECFDFVRRQLTFCVRPSAAAQNQVSGPCHVEVFMQLALLDEAEGDLKKARMTLERLLIETSSHGPCSLLFRCRNLVPKIRRILGCLALIEPTIFENDSSALALLLKATEEDPQDSLNWYYLGRLYLQLRQPTKAYDAYQQAVYRDGRNAAFWNSIGLLYFGIGQFRDALDALTRAVHHAPHYPTLWWNLGLLYESCHGLGSEDAREAYQKGFEYARARNDPVMTGKFESKLQQKEKGTGITSEVTGTDPSNSFLDQVTEMDANRFVIRVLAAFPRPQSAASMSRFLTYRGQQAQAAQAQGVRRPGNVAAGYPQMRVGGPVGGNVPPPPSVHQQGRPPIRPNVYGYPPNQPSQYR